MEEEEEEEEENGALSPSMLVPLRMLTYHGGESSDHRQLAIVTPTSSALTTTTSRFKLPKGWYVKKVPRTDGSRIDKYYREPGTGHKFRSLKEIERYLTGGEYPPRRRSRRALTLGNDDEGCGSRKMVVSGGMLLRLDMEESDQHQLAIVAPTPAAATSLFSLPDGWVVEEVPRGGCYGQTDKYYYEPGTGRKFRSLISVERYLEEMGDNAPLSQVFKLGSHVKNSGSRKKIYREKVKTPPSDAAKPPAKINWILADSGGRTWDAFMGESMVPDPVKQQWANRFMLCVNGENCAAADFPC